MSSTLSCFVLMRNERSILGPFLDQLQEFFDIWCVIDHESTDGSLEYLQSRLTGQAFIYRLSTDGYPQSELATKFTHELLSTTNADWVFYLDCDEFLPFATRAELDNALAALANDDVAFMYWRNLAPSNLDGSDIFSSGFETLPQLSPYRKIAVSRNLLGKSNTFVIEQGYHNVSGVENISEACLSTAGLLHIPVQSRFRFASKISKSAKRLLKERKLLSRGLGFHWVEQFENMKKRGANQYDFAGVGLFYPNYPKINRPPGVPLEFSFPYVHTAYEESGEFLIGDLLAVDDIEDKVQDGFVLTEVSAERSVARKSREMPMILEAETRAAPERSDNLGRLPEGDSAKLYSTVIEPLFSLPLKLPMTAWAGHVPFLFALIKTMRPKSYVDLGVHYGASLIAAATASKSFNAPTAHYGVDTWGGDEHAGFYEGDQIYADLKAFVENNFNDVNLMRCLFDEAVSSFQEGSIDILHIDGLHSYEAVRHDFETWLGKVSKDGVILFHDTVVRERGFGVFELWAELEKRYTTIEFLHSFGLGVVFLDPDSERVKPLADIARNESATVLYRSLASNLGEILWPRMEHLEWKRTNPDGASDLNELVGLMEERESSSRAYARALELESENSLPRLFARALGKVRAK